MNNPYILGMVAVLLLCVGALIVLDFDRVVDRALVVVFTGIIFWENRYRRGMHSKRITDRYHSAWYYVHLARTGRE